VTFGPQTTYGDRMGTQLDLSDLPRGVSYLPRESWGLTDAEGRRRGLSVQPGNLPELFVHHTAGSFPDLTDATWDDDPIRFIQHLDRYARETKKYKALDYSWVIHTAPGNVVTVIEGRGDYYPAATSGRNTNSKAMCYAGNYHIGSGPKARSPRQREVTAGSWLRHALIRAKVLQRNPAGYGHFQNPSCLNCTSCPGNLLIPHLGDIFADYAPLPPEPPVPPPPPPPARGALLEMYLIKYRKPGWPGEFIARVTADKILHAQQANATKVDERHVPTVTLLKPELVALLEDRARVHVSLDANGENTQNPFVGEYADSDLNRLW